MIGRRAGTIRVGRKNYSLWTRLIDSIFYLFGLAEFEILFVSFVIATFIIFKDLTARPEYNRIFVKKPEEYEGWPFPRH